MNAWRPGGRAVGLGCEGDEASEQRESERDHAAAGRQARGVQSFGGYRTRTLTRPPEVGGGGPARRGPARPGEASAGGGPAGGGRRPIVWGPSTRPAARRSRDRRCLGANGKPDLSAIRSTSTSASDVASVSDVGTEAGRLPVNRSQTETTGSPGQPGIEEEQVFKTIVLALCAGGPPNPMHPDALPLAQYDP